MCFVVGGFTFIAQGNIFVIYELTRCLTVSDHSNTLDQHLYYMRRDMVGP